MTTRACHCTLGESKVPLSINTFSKVSQISASVVHNLNLPSIFDGSSLQCSFIDVKVPTMDGFCISQMNLVVSYSLSSGVLLGSD